jgi:acetyl-CoA acetyltransferase
MGDVWIIGAYCSNFGKHADCTVKDLTREAYAGVLSDAGIDEGAAIGSAWFGNCGMWVDGQGSIRGQVCFTPLINEGSFPRGVPIVNVEGGCATGSLALYGAFRDVAAGATQMSVALGVEKTYYPQSPLKTAALFNGGIDQYDPAVWQNYYAQAAASIGTSFNPSPDRTLFMDTYALQAAWHMKTFGTTQRDLAAAAAKNHSHAVFNPKAQYRFPMSIDQVLADRPVTWPLTRAMCAPIGDGAASALVVSEEYLRNAPPRVKERAVRITGMGLSGGHYRTLDGDGLSRYAAKKAYSMASIGPERIDVAEVHDATAFGEIYQAEMLGFCERGAGGRFIASGATTLGGKLPINTSGGLISKGHPVGATGLSMIYELTSQLRAEAGERQVPHARLALAENGGGAMGFDEAVCVVSILAAHD